MKSSFKEKYLKSHIEEDSHNKYRIEKRRYQKSERQKGKLEQVELNELNPLEQRVERNPERFDDTVGEDILDSGRSILQRFLQEHNIEASIVPSFSELLLDAIFVKSLVFHVRPTGACVVIVLLAEDRVESALVATALASYGTKSRVDVNLASRSMAIEATGYPLGCVPPIAHRKQMPVIIDSNLVDKMKDLSNSDLEMFLSAGGGEMGYDLMISLQELLKLSFVSVAPLADQSPMKRKAIETRIVKALKTKSKPNSTDPSKPPTLSQFRRAAMADDSECLAVLIEQISNRGMVREMADLPSAEGGKTALHLAAWRGNITSVQMLLDHGANINLVSTGVGNYGKSPIFYAITRCRDNVVNLLLDRGANVSIVNNKGQSPRSLAVSHLPESTQTKIMLQEEQDLTKWINYRETHSDNITYGDLDSRFLDEYVDLISGKTIEVDRYAEFRCIEPSSFESRWRGNFTYIARNKLQQKTHNISKDRTVEMSKPCQHKVPCNCRPDQYTYGPLPPPPTVVNSSKEGCEIEDGIASESFISMHDVSMTLIESQTGEANYEEEFEIPTIVVDNEESLTMFKSSLQQLMMSSSSSGSYIGIDCEWKPHEKGTYNQVSILQIALSTVVFLCDLSIFPTECIDILVDILETKRIMKLGFSVHSDLERLFASYLLKSSNISAFKVSVKNVIDLVELTKLIPENLIYSYLGDESRKKHKNGRKKKHKKPTLSLSMLSKVVLGKKLDKSMQCSPWHIRPLSIEQIRYAALDAAVLCAIFKSIELGHNGWMLDQTWIDDQSDVTYIYNVGKMIDESCEIESEESLRGLQKTKSNWIFDDSSESTNVNNDNDADEKYNLKTSLENLDIEKNTSITKIFVTMESFVSKI